MSDGELMAWFWLLVYLAGFCGVTLACYGLVRAWQYITTPKREPWETIE